MPPLQVTAIPTSTFREEKEGEVRTSSNTNGNNRNRQANRENGSLNHASLSIFWFARRGSSKLCCVLQARDIVLMALLSFSSSRSRCHPASILLQGRLDAQPGMRRAGTTRENVRLISAAGRVSVRLKVTILYHSGYLNAQYRFMLKPTGDYTVHFADRMWT